MAVQQCRVLLLVLGCAAVYMLLYLPMIGVRMGRSTGLAAVSDGSLHSVPSSRQLLDVFKKSDVDHDGTLSLAEFESAARSFAAHSSSGMAESSEAALMHPNTFNGVQPFKPAARTVSDVPVFPAAARTFMANESASHPSAAKGILQDEEEGLLPLPQCSLLFFFHVVKTAGTTMRMLLQRQAQYGEFEYLYTGSTAMPRWQLVMHQLVQNVSSRRLIVEIHAEWGLHRGFFADVRELRRLYAAIGCRVTVATVLRNPLSWYVSMFNWRASNAMPLCAYQPPMDGLSRQMMGYALPFTKGASRFIELPYEAVLSVLRHVDVVGLTEYFDETLALLAARAGIRRLGYAHLAENNKPRHPKLAKAVLRAMHADASVESARSAFRPQPSLPRRAADFGSVVWSDATLRAVADFNEESIRFVERSGAKADCNYFPCAPPLDEAKGVWSRTHCARVTPRDILHTMLNHTHTDRAVHAYILSRLSADLSKEQLAIGSSALDAKLAAVRAESVGVSQRRAVALGEHNRNLCHTRLCGTPLRSCVDCDFNMVPGIESCWPSWEDQFAPDEHRFWCKRSWTIPGIDEQDLKAKHHPKVGPIPCWQTCWEPMRDVGAGGLPAGAEADHGKVPTCLRHGAPHPSNGSARSACTQPLRCSPACAKPLFDTLDAFWKHWKERPLVRNISSLNISCPCGPGG